MFHFYFLEFRFGSTVLSSIQFLYCRKASNKDRVSNKRRVSIKRRVFVKCTNKRRGRLLEVLR